jgi:hypothetical protein
MKNVSRFMFLLGALVIVGVVLFLSTWDIPAPSVEVEKIIPNDDLPK